MRMLSSSGLVHGTCLLGEPDGLGLLGVDHDGARHVHLVRHPHQLADHVAPGGQVEVQRQGNRPARGRRQHQAPAGAVQRHLLAVDDRRHHPVALPRLVVPANLRDQSQVAMSDSMAIMEISSSSDF